MSDEGDWAEAAEAAEMAQDRIDDEMAELHREIAGLRGEVDGLTVSEAYFRAETEAWEAIGREWEMHVARFEEINGAAVEKRYCGWCGRVDGHHRIGAPVTQGMIEHARACPKSPTVQEMARLRDLIRDLAAWGACHGCPRELPQDLERRVRAAIGGE